LGYSVTIRYAEGLLLLPMGLCILYVLWDKRKSLLNDWRPIAQALAMCAGWGLPVAALLMVNKSYFNSWSGYDPTHESTAFLRADLQANWDMMFKQFYLSSLIFVFPLSLIGLCIWFRNEPKQAAFIAAWALPCVFIYLVYYWAPERLNLSYSRFFFTAFPPLAITACYMMKRIDAIAISPRQLGYVAAACGVIGLLGGWTDFMEDSGRVGTDVWFDRRPDWWGGHRGDPYRQTDLTRCSVWLGDRPYRGNGIHGNRSVLAV